MGCVCSFHVCIIPHRYVIDVCTVSRKSIIGFTSLTMVNLKYQFAAIKWPSYRYSVSFLLLTSKWFMPCQIFRALDYSIHPSIDQLIYLQQICLNFIILNSDNNGIDILARKYISFCVQNHACKNNCFRGKSYLGHSHLINHPNNALAFLMRGANL